MILNQLVRAGDIGKTIKKRELEPLTAPSVPEPDYAPEPVEEPVPVSVPEPEKVPA